MEILQKKKFLPARFSANPASYGGSINVAEVCHRAHPRSVRDNRTERATSEDSASVEARRHCRRSIRPPLQLNNILTTRSQRP